MSADSSSDPAHDPDPEASAAGADEHERVARPGAEVGADVERRCRPDEHDAGDEQCNAHQQAVVSEVGEEADRREALDERPDEQRICHRAEPRLAAERPREAEHEQRDDDVRHPERERRVLGDPLVQHVPR